jgi:hypothetical protein
MAYVTDYELIYNELDKKIRKLSIAKKFEFKDELMKELATKADLEILKTELEAKIEISHKELEAKMEKEILKIDKKFTIMFIILAFLIIFINKDVIELIIKLLPFAK